MKHTFYFETTSKIYEIAFTSNDEKWIEEINRLTVYSKEQDGKIVADYNLNKRMHKHSNERLYRYLNKHYSYEIGLRIADDIHESKNDY